MYWLEGVLKGAWKGFWHFLFFKVDFFQGLLPSPKLPELKFRDINFVTNYYICIKLIHNTYGLRLIQGQEQLKTNKTRLGVSSCPPGCIISPHNSKVSIDQFFWNSSNVAVVETIKLKPRLVQNGREMAR